MNVKELVSRYEEQAVALRRDLHRHPELSMQEFETTAHLRQELGALGIPVLDSGLETGLIAEIHGKKPGPKKLIAVRADIDALPIAEKTGLPFSSENEGVCHACGHDLHMAALMLAARVLKQAEDGFCGTVRLLFQPAEEKGRGARMMIEHGAMEDSPSLVLGLHTWPDLPGGTVGVRPGAASASSDTVRIKVKGTGGHGAHPYRCVDPIAASAYLLTQLQTIISRELPAVEAGVLTFGSIHGGTAPNVIPGEVEIQGTLRSLSAEWRSKMTEAIHRVCEGCCTAMRAQAEVTVDQGMPVLFNDPGVIGLIRQASDRALGEGKVQELGAASPGSDDFSCYLDYAPGALFRIGTGNDDPASHIGLHNAQNLFDERGIAAGAAVIAQLALDYLGE